jgi:hypothetical protein
LNIMKEQLLKIWASLGKAGKGLLGLVIAAILATSVFAVANKQGSDSQPAPEIAQVYEPSIGTPLPPDVAGGAVAEAPAAPETATTPQAGQSQGEFSQPSRGYLTGQEPAVSAAVRSLEPADSGPVQYQNTLLKFAATLPSDSRITENADGATFSTPQGKLLYLVSVSEAGGDSLQHIENQLRNSSSVSNLIYTQAVGQPALSFTAHGLGSGLAIVANGKVYYLFGSNQYFPEFKLI